MKLNNRICPRCGEGIVLSHCRICPERRKASDRHYKDLAQHNFIQLNLNYYRDLMRKRRKVKDNNFETLLTIVLKEQNLINKLEAEKAELQDLLYRYKELLKKHGIKL